MRARTRYKQGTPQRQNCGSMLSETDINSRQCSVAQSLLSKADRLAELGRSGQGIKELSKERDDGESTSLSQEDPSVVESAASALFNRITRIA